MVVFIISLLTFTALALFMINQYDTFRLKKNLHDKYTVTHSFNISVFSFFILFSLPIWSTHLWLWRHAISTEWDREHYYRVAASCPRPRCPSQVRLTSMLHAACFKEASLLLITIHISEILSMLVWHHTWCAICFPLMSGIIFGITRLPSDYLQLLFTYLLIHQNCWHYSTWDLT